MDLPLVTILCPTDLSATGDAAVATAFALAAPGGTVHLLHVWEPAYVLSPLDATPVVMLPTTPEQDQGHERSVREHLQRLVPADAARRGVRSQIEIVKESNAVGAIARVATRVSAGAIVMGTHGRTGLGRVFMGSVASDVLKAATVPVILVSDPAARRAERAPKSPVKQGGA